MKSRQRLTVQRVVACGLIIGCGTTVTLRAQGPGQNGRPGGRPGGGPGRGGPGGGFGRPGGNFHPPIKMRLNESFASIAALDRGSNPLTKDQAKRALLLMRPWQKKATMSDSEAQSLLTKFTAILTPKQKTELNKAIASHLPPRGGGPGGPGGGPGRGGPGGPPGGPGGPPPGEGFGGPPPPDGRAQGSHRGPGPDRGPGNSGRPGGPPDAAHMKQMRQQMQKMQGFFKTFNPFYPPSAYKEIKDMPPPMRDGWKHRYQLTSAVMAHLAQKAGIK